MKKWPKALICFIGWGILWASIYTFNGFRNFGLHGLCFLLGSPVAISLGIMCWEGYQDKIKAEQDCQK